jgi:integrase
LNVSLKQYFDITTKEYKYSLETNKGIKTTLVMILNSARKLGLIEYNYATKEYQETITGTVIKKEIYDEQGTKEFLRQVSIETDIRKRTIFYLYIYLGLRNAEVCGLEWNDINFDSEQLSINRNSLYFNGFGVKTKEPKTKNSKRTITMPSMLVTVLKKYKEYWIEQKAMHGDLWEFTDRLFVQDNGKPINPCTCGTWLRKFQAEKGLQHISPHKLRHTSITMQLIAGVPIKAVSQRAGHASENITLRIYTRLLKDEEKKAAEKFNDFLTKAI